MGAASGALEAMQSLGGLSMSNNFDNEVEILKSRTLIRKVVTQLGLYTSMEEDRMLGYDIPLYQSSPINVFMSPEEAEKLEAGARLKLSYSPEGKLYVKVRYTLNEEEEEAEKTFDKLPAVFPTPAGVFSFTANDSILNEWKAKESSDIRLAAYVGAPTAVAKSYGENLTVEATSKTTTIAQISVKNSSRQRAIDFINCLVAFYNQDANDEKNEVAQKTADFIEDRIGIINQELGSTETQLADFKQKSGLTDLTSDAQLALQENSKYEQLRIENQTQIRLVEFLRDYINNPANEQEVIPANVGLQDQNLSSVIDQYNTMLIERKRLLRTSSENNPAVVNMNTGIEAMRHNVQTTVASVLKGLQITRATSTVRHASSKAASAAPLSRKKSSSPSPASRKSRHSSTSCCCRSVRKMPLPWQPPLPTDASSRKHWQTNFRYLPRNKSSLLPPLSSGWASPWALSTCATC